MMAPNFTHVHSMELIICMYAVLITSRYTSNHLCPVLSAGHGAEFSSPLHTVKAIDKLFTQPWWDSRDTIPLLRHQLKSYSSQKRASVHIVYQTGPAGVGA